MNDQDQIELLKLEILTLKIAVHRLIRINEDIQATKLESYYDRQVLESETSKLKRDLLLNSEYIREYASLDSIICANLGDDVLNYLD